MERRLAKHEPDEPDHAHHAAHASHAAAKTIDETARRMSPPGPTLTLGQRWATSAAEGNPDVLSETRHHAG